MANLSADRPRPIVRTFVSLGAASTLALALAACGGGGGGGRVGTVPTPPPSATPPPVVTPAPTPAPSPFVTAEFMRSDGPEQHGAITAWQGGRTGAGQAIAIIDTGIDTTSPEFAGRILAASRDVAGGGRTVQAEDDHGTNVALVAAAARNNSGIMGIAFDASLLVLRADTPGSCVGGGTGASEPECSFNDSSIARGVDAAVAARARVINISLGGSSGISTTLTEAVRRAAAANVVIVISAGNGGTGNRPGIDPAQPSPTAAAVRQAGGSNVIIVGSVDEGNQISAFSQRAGNEAAWFLTARGERICCVYENGQIFVGRDANGAFNLLFSGTSFAAPQVSGAVALLAQAFPNLTAGQIVRLLLDSAREAGAAGVDPVYGAGILDIAAAIAPRGAMTLAGSTAVVSPGAGMMTGSPAMGDALAGGGPVIGVALDSYARAYNVDLARGARGAAVQRRLSAALAQGVRAAGAGAGPLALAYTVGQPMGGAGDTPWARQLRLSGEEGEGARMLAARVAARIAPNTEMALGFREGASGIAAQLRGASEPAFLIARDAGSDTGFARSSDASAALRHRIAGWGLTAAIERGTVWYGDDLTPAEAVLGAPRERMGFSSITLAADRRFGALAAELGMTWLGEDRSLLGARFAPALGFGGADSLFLDAGARLDLAPRWQLGAAWRQGWSRARIAGLVADGAPMTSSAWSLDVARSDALIGGDSLALRLSQPLRVTGGGLALRLPVGYDYDTLLPSYGIRTLALAPTGREIDAELAWRAPLWGGHASASLYWRTEPGHYALMPDDTGMALRWRRDF